MSLKLNERYPGRFNNPSADYPAGSFKNRTTPDAKDGSYLEKDWANDKEGFFQSLLSAANVEPNGTPDKVGGSQFFDSMIQIRRSQIGTAFTTTGSSPALVLTPSPSIVSYSSGQRFRIKFNVPSTGADTINVSGLGAKSIKQYGSSGAKSAAVFYSGQLSDVEYDGTDFIMLNPLSSDTASLSARVSALEAIGKPFTKQFISTQQTMAVGSGITLAHGFGSEPKFHRAYVVCTTASDGYAVGDKVFLDTQQFDTGTASSNYGLNVKFDSVNLYLRFAVNGVAILFNPSTAAIVTLTNAASNFRLIVEAWA